ncbi:unnamed protein product [Amoebophrya sp. A25]|nr:unnamed protein product [Amoebophrya sp. A25]|eukprot:GSA25T00014833001.1
MGEEPQTTVTVKTNGSSSPRSFLKGVCIQEDGLSRLLDMRSAHEAAFHKAVEDLPNHALNYNYCRFGTTPRRAESKDLSSFAVLASSELSHDLSSFKATQHTGNLSHNKWCAVVPPPRGGASCSPRSRGGDEPSSPSPRSRGGDEAVGKDRYALMDKEATVDSRILCVVLQKWLGSHPAVQEDLPKRLAFLRMQGRIRIPLFVLEQMEKTPGSLGLEQVPEEDEQVPDEPELLDAQEALVNAAPESTSPSLLGTTTTPTGSRQIVPVQALDPSTSLEDEVLLVRSPSSDSAISILTPRRTPRTIASEKKKIQAQEVAVASAKHKKIQSKEIQAQQVEAAGREYYKKLLKDEKTARKNHDKNPRSGDVKKSPLVPPALSKTSSKSSDAVVLSDVTQEPEDDKKTPSSPVAVPKKTSMLVHRVPPVMAKELRGEGRLPFMGVTKPRQSEAPTRPPIKGSMMLRISTPTSRAGTNFRRLPGESESPTAADLRIFTGGTSSARKASLLVERGDSTVEALVPDPRSTGAGSTTRSSSTTRGTFPKSTSEVSRRSRSSAPKGATSSSSPRAAPQSARTPQSPRVLIDRKTTKFSAAVAKKRIVAVASSNLSGGPKPAKPPSATAAAKGVPKQLPRPSKD